MTKASDYAFNEGFDFVFDGQRGTAFINPYMDAYVESYEGRILGAAEEHNLPSYLLAGVVWIEAGGDPLELECFTATARAFAQGTDAADATSYGDISMQIRTAAETLGYDSANLHPRQRAPPVDSLMSPDQGIAIAAMHLSQWRDRQGRSGGASVGTDSAMLGTIYNGGKYALDWDLSNPTSHGSRIVAMRNHLDGLLAP